MRNSNNIYSTIDIIVELEKSGGNINISKKYDALLLTGFIFLVFFILLTSLIGVLALNKTNSFFEKTYKGAFTELIETEYANADLIAVHRAMKDVALSRDSLQLNAALKDVDKYDAEIKMHFAILYKMDADNALLSDVIKAYNNWAPIRAKTLEFAKNGQYEAAAENTRTIGAAQVGLITNKMQLYINNDKTIVERTFQSSADISAKSLYGLLLLTLIETILAVCISVYIRRKLLSYRAKLHDEREQLQVTFDSIGDGVITTDIYMNVQKLNKVAEELTGWKTDEAFGKPITEVFAITDVIKGEITKDTAEEVFAANKICMLENHTVLTSKDGIDRHIDDGSAQIKDEYGTAIGVVMTFRDVTEKRKTQYDLKESANRLISAQSMAHVGNWELNLDTQTIWASEEVFNIYGIMYNSQYLPIKLVQESVLQEYRVLLDNALIGLITNNEKYDIKYKIKNIQTGEERFVHSKAELSLDESGNATKVVGTIQDITDFKKAEEEILYLSYHDQLTGLYNRRFYEEELKRLDTERNLPLTLIMGDVNGLKLINDSFGHVMGDELLQKVAEVLKRGCRTDEVIARLGGDEFVLILPKTDALETEKIIKRIEDLASKEKIGSIDISISFGYETKNNAEEKIEEIFKKAEDYMYKKKLFESPSMRGKTIKAIMNTLHEKNKREEQHSHRVSALCKIMGEALGLPEYEVEELKSVGLIHDIGKIAVDENILNKPGKLTDDEWKEIKRHPEIGYRILNTVNDMSDMANYTLYHHERWDGKGYPKGLKEEQIPFVSRIITIADAYDAMTSERSYRSALSEEIVIEELRKNAGLQFDPELVRVFIEKVLGQISGK